MVDHQHKIFSNPSLISDGKIPAVNPKTRNM